MIFDDKKINNSNFYKNKKLFNIYDLEVDKILISKNFLLRLMIIDCFKKVY